MPGPFECVCGVHICAFEEGKSEGSGDIRMEKGAAYGRAKEKGEIMDIRGSGIMKDEGRGLMS